MGRRRKFGISDIIIIVIIISLVVGIAIQFFGVNARQEKI